VNDDGTVVAGGVHDGVDLHAIRWTSSGGMQDLGVAPGALHSFGNGVSGDGATIVGDEHGGANGGGPFHWTSAGGLQGLSFPWVTSYVSGVSGDGAIVIGYGQAADTHFYGFRWSTAGGMQLVDPFDLFGDETPSAVSRDGSVIVGSFYYGGAFRWSSAGAMQNLGALPGQLYAQAFDVSDDGSVVVGSSGTWTSSTGWSYLDAFRWTAGGGMQDLGLMPGDARSEAIGVSGDGSIVVGTRLDQALTTQRSFVWTQASGMVDLGAWVATLGVNLSGWDLGDVRAISADGTALLGLGLFNGQVAGWIVTGLGASAPAPYCTAKTNSLGCTPVIGSNGFPSQAGADDFHVTASNVLNNKSGLMAWSTVQGNAPFFGGTLCIASPIDRTPFQNSGGNAGALDCSGTYTFHFSQAYVAAHSLAPGATVRCQFWSRDPGFTPPNNIGLTDGLRFLVWP
jgi:probable HAF family extracellular repeat protein